MPIYTVKDNETGKQVKFKWQGQQPPTEQDMLNIFAEARQTEIPTQKPSLVQNQLKGIEQGFKNIARGYPVGEALFNVGTSTYGIPISGLAGLFALPLGLEKSAQVIKKVQNALIYKPVTTHGQEFTEAITSPYTLLTKAGQSIGKKIEKRGHPYLGAAAESAVTAAPVIIGGLKAIGKSTPGRVISRLDREINAAIDKGINKAIRPSVVKKEMHSQVAKYRNRTRMAVKEIVKNKDSLELLDAEGLKIGGLPKTLDQFSQAIEQVKTDIFRQYDSLTKATGKEGIKIPLNPIADQLRAVIKNKTLNDLSPETVAYAVDRLSTLVRKQEEIIQQTKGPMSVYGAPTRIKVGKTKGRGTYTAMETQEAIQLLNQTLEAFYKNPTPAMKGKAYVDAMIANYLRKQLDATIKKTTGKNYQALKSKYGALRTLETDVTKQAIVDARKNIKGLIDFSDVYTGYHIVRGILSREPSTFAAGVVGKGISRYIKWRNEPNRVVNSMFGDVEKLIARKNIAISQVAK